MHRGWCLTAPLKLRTRGAVHRNCKMVVLSDCASASGWKTTVVSLEPSLCHLNLDVVMWFWLIDLGILGSSAAVPHPFHLQTGTRNRNLDDVIPNVSRGVRGYITTKTTVPPHMVDSAITAYRWKSCHSSLNSVYSSVAACHLFLKMCSNKR